MTFTFGVDYYPEHWQEGRWATDARLMQEAGINFVRMAEFAWSRLEPSEGNYDFEWLARAIEVFASHGIQVMLGTPTASAPAWIANSDPDYFLVRQDGVKLTYGSRRDYCPSNPTYRQHGRRITEAMARYFADNPHVMGWQIDNEFGDRCFCPTCRQAFATWLERKYQTLSQLNKSWGTVFWSHEYSDWSQIPTALGTLHAIHNPSLHLDYYRFLSDTYVDFQQEQIDILRTYYPNHPITHNFMGFKYDNINYFDLAKSLDFVSWDNYPRGFWIDDRHIDPALTALEHETMRALKNKPFWVMESHSGPAGWTDIGLTPRPGEIRLWAYQAVAHGADGIVFFRWRSCRFGAEQYWHGVLDHDGKPRRRYAEVKQMGQEIKRIGEGIVNTDKPAEVAMMLSYDARFALQIQPNNKAFSYPTLLRQYYRAFHHENISVHIVPPLADVTAYKILIVPALYVMDDALCLQLQTYVEDGGTLIVTARSGVKDENNIIPEAPLPTYLAGLCGIEVEDYDSLLPDMRVPVAFNDGTVALAQIWCDIITPISAQTVATYQGEFYAGKPAITRNRHGQGQVYYVGALGDDTLIDAVVRHIIAETELTASITSPPQVEIVRRGDVLFMLNHSDTDQVVHLGDKVRVDIITEQTKQGACTLAPRQVMLLTEG